MLKVRRCGGKLFFTKQLNKSLNNFRFLLSYLVQELCFIHNLYYDIYKNCLGGPGPLCFGRLRAALIIHTNTTFSQVGIRVRFELFHFYWVVRNFLLLWANLDYK